MKYACILLLIFQQAIPPKANTIVLKPVSFNEVCSALVEQGYQLEAKDSALQTVRTVPRNYQKKYQSTYVINIRLKDSIAFITGTFAGMESSAIPIYNDTGAGGKTRPNLPGYGFTLMNQFALSFGKPVQYLKK